jgi:integrase
VFQRVDAKYGFLSRLRRAFKEACKIANIDHLRFHDLRHAAATRIVEKGKSLHAVAKLLGHTTIRVIERYSHPENGVREATDILANFS